MPHVHQRDAGGGKTGKTIQQESEVARVSRWNCT